MEGSDGGLIEFYSCHRLEDDVEKRKLLTLLGRELRPVGRPVRNQSLYQLRYPGS
jgi:hypothetical protein